MASIIELSKVDKIYKGAVSRQVLFQINLNFESGTFNSIIGTSGSGKSTLLNIIGTLDRPSSGEVVIDGKNTNDMKKNKLAELRNETIGFVFQFHYLLPEFTAMENVLIPHMIGKGRPPRHVKARAEELLGLLGIARVKDNISTNMSGGEQQRTAIARALMNNPKVLLADEPTGNLDSENSANLYRVFRDINTKYGTTFIIVTHDRKIAEQTDRIIEIRDGKIETDIRR